MSLPLAQIKKPLTKIFEILRILVSKNILKDLSEHLDASLCSPGNLWNNSEKDSIVKGLPQKFRIVKDCNIPFSASGIFTSKQAGNAIKTITNYHEGIKRIFFIDLLKEYHCFIDRAGNHFPLSFRAEKNAVNYGVPYRNIEKLEKIIFETLSQRSQTVGIKFASWFITHEGAIKEIFQSIIKKNINFYTERDLIKKLSDSYECELLYKRLPCMDHMSPTHQSVVSFASFIQNEFNPETDWLHIHCHGGSGRSTSFSVLFDMFMRIQDGDLQKISFLELIQTHKDSGGKDLNPDTTQYDASKDWKSGFAKERYAALENIYKNLIIIENYGLKSVFSTALTIMLLKQEHPLHIKLLEDIINDSGNSVIEKINTDLQLYNKLSDFYNEYYDSEHVYKQINGDISTLDQTENIAFNEFEL